MTDLRDLSFEELRTALAALDVPAYRTRQIFAWLYQKKASSFEAMSDLPRDLREKLGACFSFQPLEVAGLTRSRDGTSKTLFRLADGLSVETVLIPAGTRRTVCLSTQAGCKFACAFCASGLLGFRRDLTTAEILGQVLYFRDVLDVGLTNIVFMGMGEPLDNFDNVEKAIRILNDPRGFGFAARRMTVSTSGFVPGIARFKKLDLQINLSVSLHAADDETRSRLMPINRRFPLADVMAACEDYLGGGGRKLTFEYVLIKGLNDRPEDAERLARIARDLRAKVNLIPYSPVPGLAFERPGIEEMSAFSRRLENRGVEATLRDSKGSDIQAACGQLALRTESPTVPVENEKSEEVFPEKKDQGPRLGTDGNSPRPHGRPQKNELPPPSTKFKRARPWIKSERSAPGKDARGVGHDRPLGRKGPEISKRKGRTRG
jgi:23S rRNA (adenine2503-C2)-methyltransferase